MSIRVKLTLTFGGLAAMVLVLVGSNLKTPADADNRFTSYIGGINAPVNTGSHLRSAVKARKSFARNLVLLTQAADMAAVIWPWGGFHGDW
jgi:hypothetical protein